MPNTALNRTTAFLGTNKSGGALVYGDVVILDNATTNGFTTTTSAGLATRGIAVILEPNGIANNASGMIATGGWIPKINLNTAATVGQFIKTHTVAGQGTPHASPQITGDFAVALEASATPSAVLFGSPNGTVGGTVTNTGTLTSGTLIQGNGGVDVTLNATTAVVTKLTAGVPSAAAAGTDYLNPATGLTWIEQQTPTGTSVTFSSLGTFTHLKIVYSARGDQVATSSNILLTFNGDTGSNYDTQNDIASGSTAAASEGLAAANVVVATISAASAPSGAAGRGEIIIADYRGTTFRKGGQASGHYKLADSSGNFVVRLKGFEWRSTAAITSITLTLSSGNFVSGSKFTLYGLP